MDGLISFELKIGFSISILDSKAGIFLITLNVWYYPTDYVILSTCNEGRKTIGVGFPMAEGATTPETFRQKDRT